MNTLKTFEKATILVNNGWDEKTSSPIQTEKTWIELTDSEKQTIASDWIKDHVLTNVNQVCELLMQHVDLYDYDELMNIAESQDYDEVSKDHINDLTIDELVEVIAEYDLESEVDHVELFKNEYLNDLIENTKNTSILNEDIFHELEITFLQSLPFYLKDYTLELEESTGKSLEKELLSYFNTVDYSFDDLDTCITNLNINFDGYLKAFQGDLASLIIDNIDLDQYGQDNSLDPEYNQAYEYWAVSDHFLTMTQNDLSVSNDILGLTVWARYCTGQAIALDYAIQVAAFKALSNCHYDHY